MSAFVLNPLAFLLILRGVMRELKKSDFIVKLFYAETHLVSAYLFYYKLN